MFLTEIGGFRQVFLAGLKENHVICRKLGGSGQKEPVLVRRGSCRADEARAAGDEKIHGPTLNNSAPKEQRKLASHPVAGLVRCLDLRSGGTQEFPCPFRTMEFSTLPDTPCLANFRRRVATSSSR